ncbi:MAG: TonB-dependent receptor [Sphingobacteriales bacterium BACL12 MAG-120813-bin55]|jgi:hypothetical protein|nr:MAG: TonB-dependent receptor [Sphingobacteriales bacterium BACL12 MAG-120813-bin55]
MRHFILTTISILFISLLSAQVDLVVSVTDLASAEPLEGITVNIENIQIGFTDQGLTDDQGKVRFKGLPTNGLYNVQTVGNAAYYPASASNIELKNNEKASVQLTMARISETTLEEVAISAKSTTRINTINAEVASELNLKEIQQIPVEGRDITRVLFRLPNVVQATGFYPEAPSVSIMGANSLYTNYTIDGFDNNERFLGGQKFAIPVGFARNVTVLTNNYSTEYGLTGNGVIDITTRSGSNDFSAEAFYVTRPGAAIDTLFTGASPYTQRDLSGNQVNNTFMRQQFGIGFGGAITKDKTFYYVNVEQTFDFKENLLDVDRLNLLASVPGQNTFTYVSGKIDHRWSNRFCSSLRANLGLTGIERQGGGLEGGVAFPSAANTQQRNAFIIASKNSYVGAAFSSETNVQYSRFRWNYADPVNGAGPSVTVFDSITPGPIAILGHPGYYFDDLENTIQLQQKLNFYRGNHTIKTGVEFISSDFQLAAGGNPDGNYSVLLSSAQFNDIAQFGTALDVNDIPADALVTGYSVELRPATFGTRQNIISIYAEDQYSVNNRLNLTFGLRYDYDDLSKGGSEQGDLNNLAPRASFNYKLNNRSVLRGGYAMVYDKILYAVYSDALQQNTNSADYRRQLQALIDQGALPENTNLDLITFEGTLSAFAAGVPYLNGPSAAELQAQRDQVFSAERRILNPNGFQNPQTHQFSLGYQVQLSEDKLFYIDGFYNKTNFLYRLRDVNAPAPFYPGPAFTASDVRDPAAADLTRPVAIYEGSYAIIDGDTVYGVARNVVMTETAGESRFFGISLNLQKDRSDDNYSWRFIYTLSRNENNTEDINFRAMDANRFEDEWGPSINDRTHVFNTIFNLFPWEGWQFTFAGLVQSGMPINRIPDAALYGTIDLNGDLSTNAFTGQYTGITDRSPGETRNSDRLPWNNTIDLAAQYTFNMKGGGHFEIRADVFNLLNAENLSGYFNNATQSNQIQVGPASSGVLVRRNAAPPRQFQFGARYYF